MIVAVPFACVRPECVTVRGVVFCPQSDTAPLLARFGADGKRSRDTGAVEGRGTARRWVKRHFALVDPPTPRARSAPLAFKRDFAFVRLSNVAVGTNRLIIRFDVFVGPGVYPLPAHDESRGPASPRAIHGFADIAHFPLFDNEIAHGKGGPISGHAALCAVEQPDDLLGEGWRLRSDGIAELVMPNEIGSMLMVEPTAYWRQRRMRANAGAVTRDPVADPLERSLIFRARLVLKLSELQDRQVVGLSRA